MPIREKPYYGTKRLEDTDTGIPAVFAVTPKFEEERTEADGLTQVTFAEPVTHLAIYNRSEVDGVFTVNGLTITVPAGKSIPVTRFGGTPSVAVSISGSTSFILSRFD